MLAKGQGVREQCRLPAERAREVVERIRKHIQRYFRESNLTYAVFGKSEGLDSSVIAGLLSDLEGVKPIGVMMPCESNPEAERIGELVLRHFQIPWIRVDLTREFHFLMGSLYSGDGVYGQLANVVEGYGDPHLLEAMPHRKLRAAGNIKARLRMITLYHIAQLTGGIVISTDNLSEFWMGFWTLNGDVGDFAPIQQVWKGTEEYAIAKVLGVPRQSIEAVPTDGLDVVPGGTDEDQLGLSYYDLDRVIIALLQNGFDGSSAETEDEIMSVSKRLGDQTGYDVERIADVARRIRNTHYKRNWPGIIRRSAIGLPDVRDVKP